ncbi:MAG: 16S rRNA (uracil(1498)-N(3))-methyltransferase [Pseudomonadota bacterium]
MTLSRIHIAASLAPDTTIDLPEQTGHYLNRVLRLSAGDSLIAFNREGAYQATVLHARGANATLRIGEALSLVTESPLATRLVQGLCRGPRMDYCIQKATELGVQCITPVITDRCVVRLDARRRAKRTAHWQAVAVSACEQSGRTRVPTVDEPVAFDAVLSGESGELAILDADQGAPYPAWSRPKGRLSLLIGPEGGLTEGEIERATDAGAQRWRMGPRVMRTETAGVVALALAQTKWGDLGT